MGIVFFPNKSNHQIFCFVFTVFGDLNCLICSDDFLKANRHCNFDPDTKPNQKLKLDKNANHLENLDHLKKINPWTISKKSKARLRSCRLPTRNWDCNFKLIWIVYIGILHIQACIGEWHYFSYSNYLGCVSSKSALKSWKLLESANGPGAEVPMI